MATPHVAGCVALLMAAQPDPVSDIIQVLKETALHPDGKSRRPDNRWGHGLIQPVEALKARSSALTIPGGPTWQPPANRSATRSTPSSRLACNRALPTDLPIDRSALQTDAGAAGSKLPPTRAGTQGGRRSAKAAAQSALKVVDEVLEQSGERRLSDAPDALGSIRVEVTPD